MRLTIIIAGLISLYDQFWMTAFLSFIILFITFLPSIVGKNYKIVLPIEFELILIFFLYGTLFLGEIKSYYQMFWWWDIFLHTLSGVILGFIGFFVVYTLNTERKIQLNMSPNFVAIFSFAFALSMGALWEIFEFLMDYYLGFNMQKSGIVDTMVDLIVDSLGALIVAIGGYFYLKKVRTYLFDYIVNKFAQKNPHLIKKDK